MTNDSSLFSVDNLRVAYPQRRGQSGWAVDGVSLTLKPGEKLGLVGESGCGKSTLGRAAMRLLPDSTLIEGRVSFAGESVFDMNASRLRRFRGEAVALIFQDPMTRLDPLMTVGEHCIETLQAHIPNLDRKQAKKRAIDILEAVKIPASRWSQFPHEFSGGMRQRVAIALALLLDPKLIVADEPTTSLDVTVAAQILQELTRLCAERGTAILLISHDLAMVAEYCDRIAVMYGGKVVETGPVQNVFEKPQHEYTRSLLKAALHIQADSDKGLAFEEIRTEAVTANLTNSPLLTVTDLQQHYSLESNLLDQLFSRNRQVIKAVDGVSLELERGEILGLVRGVRLRQKYLVTHDFAANYRDGRQSGISRNRYNCPEPRCCEEAPPRNANDLSRPPRLSQSDDDCRAKYC